MMYIDKTNRHDFVGKSVDCERRMHHYYPLTIVRRGDAYYYVDATGTWVVFNDNERVYYDMIVQPEPEAAPSGAGEESK